MQDIAEKKQIIAKKILDLSQSQLIVHFHFLNRTIARLPFSVAKEISFATNGEHIYYSPEHVLYRYQQAKNGVTRDLLHMMLHAVFRHWLIGPNIDRERWDLACDIAVENMICELHSPHLYCEREDLQQSMYSLLKEELSVLTAEKIYKWLSEKAFSGEEIRSARETFLADGHGIWYGAFSKDARKHGDLDLKKIWEEVSRRMQTELELMEKDSGSTLVQSLHRLNKKKHDYSAFLRSFGVHGEQMKLSEEEFDQNYYTYGLELYENIPLIEPLEYSEEKRIRDLVIAIDTSGSVQGEKVQRFMQHTYDILRTEDTFFSRVNIRIIQCDDRIREDVSITNEEEFEAYIKEMELKGFGRTDFRPVFSHVEELMRKKEILQLQGLLYFTDGDGIYPEQAPPYDTAFLLNGEDADQALVPAWAMSLILDEEEPEP